MTILLVDDERDILEGMLAGIDFQSLGIEQVFTAESVVEAKTILREERVDLLLTDIEMPGESGLELLEWLRRQDMQVVTMFCTSYANFDYAKKAVEMRSFYYYLKPIAYAARRQTARRAGFQELNDAVEAFDGLSRQIEKLRIDLYEEKLAVAQTEMEYYQLQIKPHFFVNCFSLIHAMAQKQEYQRIQSFCIKLSNYVRYLFSKSLSLVPLKQELSMVQEFLDIQRIRHRVDSQLEEAVDGEAEKLCIPPLSLLTFVENAVKHGGVKSIVIQIKVELIRQNGGKRLRLSVQDTGVGFPPEILEAANSSHLGQDKGHLGICNIQKRLQLLYGENYRLSFSNNELGGLVELEFPAGESVKMSGFE